MSGKEGLLSRLKYNLEPITDATVNVGKGIAMPIARMMSGRSSEGIITPLGFSPETGTFNPQIVHDIKSLWNKESRDETSRFDQQLHDDWGVGYSGSAENGDFDSDADMAQFVGNFVPTPAGLPKLASYLPKAGGLLGKIARGTAHAVDTAADFAMPAKASGRKAADYAADTGRGLLMGSGLLGATTAGGAAYGAMRGPPEVSADEWMNAFHTFLKEGDMDAAEGALDAYYEAQARSR